MHVTKSARRISQMIQREFQRRRGVDEVRRLMASGFPSNLERAMECLVTDRIPQDVLPVTIKVEGVRDALRQRSDERFSIYYSPKPVSNVAARRQRTAPGEVKHFTASRLADSTSIPRKKGAFLHLCARDSHAKLILELGACAGISGAYLGTVPTCERFITIEASAELAGLAEESLAAAGVRGGVVINALFDDALDDLEADADCRPIDFAWIDGHHEKVATLRYLDRLLPFMKSGGLVLLDDIYWSADMYAAWEAISKRREFSDVVNCGICGLCIVGDGPTPAPRQWDLTPFVFSRPPVPAVPHGWR